MVGGLNLLYNRGSIILYKTQYAQALEVFKQVVPVYLKEDGSEWFPLEISLADTDKLNEREVTVKAKYLRAYFLAWHSRYEEAAAIYKDIIANFHDTQEALQAHYDLIMACYLEGDYSQVVNHAMPMFREMAREYPNQAGIEDVSRRLILIHQSARGTLEQMEAQEGMKGVEKRSRLLKVARLYKSIASLKGKERHSLASLSAREQSLIEILEESVLLQNDQEIFKSYEKLAAKHPDINLTEVTPYVLAYLLLTREYEQVLREIDALSKYGSKEILLQNLADLCVSLEELQLAIETYRVIADTFPGSEQALTALEKGADICEKLTIAGASVEIYRRIVDEYPESAKAVNAQEKIIAVYSEEWRAYDTAIRECRKLIEKFPDTKESVHAKYQIAQFYYTNRQYDAALSQLEKFLEAHPKSEWTKEAEMLTALSCIGKRDKENAVKQLRYLVDRYPEEDMAARAQFLIGWCFLSQQEYNQAKMEYQMVIDNYPKSRYADQAKRLVGRLTNVGR